MNNKYAFEIETSEYTDRVGRNIRVYARKDNNSHSLLSLSKEELRELAKTIIDFL